MASRVRRVLQQLLVPSLLLTLVAVGTPDFDRLKSLAQSRYGQAGVERLEQWRSMLTQQRDNDEQQQLLAVNDFFNHSVEFRNDIAIWGVSDYWATPLETLGKQQADCEDFSIAKYLSLLELGIDPQKLKITYVKADLGNKTQAHMVLAYYPSPRAEPLILDNIGQRILPASRRPDLTPFFSFNSHGLWVGGSSTRSLSDPASRLSRWRDLLARLQAEGFSL